MTNDAAVAWAVVVNGEPDFADIRKWECEREAAIYGDIPGSILVEPLYSATTVAELRAEVERLRGDALRYRQLKNGRRQPFGDTFIVKKFNRTFGEEESVSWSDMEREIDAEIAALTKESP